MIRVNNLHLYIFFPYLSNKFNRLIIKFMKFTIDLYRVNISPNNINKNIDTNYYYIIARDMIPVI